MTTAIETTTVFECAGRRLVGILHSSGQDSRIGAVIVVGGPQYRVGSHRQFLLLARHLAAAGIDVLRFDCRGMGDSEGDFPGFEAIESDIQAAVAEMKRSCPSVERLFLIGLCDGASAILMSKALQASDGGLILINPWVQSASLEARAYVRHYYLQRLLQLSFWKRLLTGKMQVGSTLASMFDKFRQSLGTDSGGAGEPGGSFPERMLAGFQRTTQPGLVILSGRDLVARQFDDLCGSNPAWRNVMSRPGVTTSRFADADHTFSATSEQRRLCRECADWILSMASGERY